MQNCEQLHSSVSFAKEIDHAVLVAPFISYSRVHVAVLMSLHLTEELNYSLLNIYDAYKYVYI